MLTGCPLCRKSHPLCRLKNPTVISIWLLVGFHPATGSVQSTPADNTCTRKRVWQYIEKERGRKKESSVTVEPRQRISNIYIYLYVSDQSVFIGSEFSVTFGDFGDFC